MRLSHSCSNMVASHRGEILDNNRRFTRQPWSEHRLYESWSVRSGLEHRPPSPGRKATDGLILSFRQSFPSGLHAVLYSAIGRIPDVPYECTERSSPDEVRQTSAAPMRPRSSIPSSISQARSSNSDSREQAIGRFSISTMERTMGGGYPCAQGNFKVFRLLQRTVRGSVLFLASGASPV
jgi:hypothetical protein